VLETLRIITPTKNGRHFFGEKDDAFVKKEKKRKNCRLLVDVFRGASVNSGVMSS